MRSQDELCERILSLSVCKTSDPLGFKRNALIEFATRETMLRVLDKLKQDEIYDCSVLRDWIPTELNRDAVETSLHRELMFAKERLLETNSQSKYFKFIRTAHKIEMILWLLEDDEALQFLNDVESYEKSAVRLVLWLEERYSKVSDCSV